MNVGDRADDERCVEVVSSGFPLYHGAQLAVDHHALCCLEQWEARPGAVRVDGTV